MCSTRAHWDHLGRCTAGRRRRHLQRRGRQCRAAPRRWSRWPKRNAKAGPGRAARSCSSRSPPRNRACSARLIMPSIRSIRSRSTVGGVNMDALNIVGPAHDFVVDRRRQVASSTAISTRALAAPGPHRHARADPGEGLSITAPTISASPSTACRCSTARAARIWSRAAAPRAQAAAKDYRRPSLSQARRTNMIPTGTGPARSQDLSALLRRRPRARRRPRLAELDAGRRIPRDPRQEPRQPEPRSDRRSAACRMGAARGGLDRLSEPSRAVAGRSRAGARRGRRLRRARSMPTGAGEKVMPRRRR